MTVKLINKHNMEASEEILRDFDVPAKFDLLYADMIYEDLDFEWISYYWAWMKWNGIFIVQTDYHSVAEVKIYMDNLPYATFVNWVIYKQEWGGVPRNRFPQKHDDILIYCRGNNWKFYPERIQIPKATAGTKLDKKGTGTKTPCSVFDDLGNFMTTSSERIKINGHNIKWQKPLKLMDRLLLPFTDEEDWICDPFMGSGTTVEWCIRNNRNCVGIEYDKDVFDVAATRINLLSKY